MTASTATSMALAGMGVFAIGLVGGACQQPSPAPTPDGGTGVIESPAGPDTVEQQPLSARAPEAPPAPTALPCEPEPELVECSGWLVSGTATGCLVVWSGCTDDHVREVRCERAGDHLTCHCVLGGSQVSTFESAKFCSPGGQSPSVDRGLYTEAVRRECGFRIGPKAPPSPR